MIPPGSASLGPAISPQTESNSVGNGRGRVGIVDGGLVVDAEQFRGGEFIDALGGIAVFGIDDENAEEMLEAEEETPAARTLPTPDMPTQSEYDAHRDNGHIPYRSWCDHCVEGRGREAGHHRGNDKVKTIPTIGFDYLFLTD